MQLLNHAYNSCSIYNFKCDYCTNFQVVELFSFTFFLSIKQKTSGKIFTAQHWIPSLFWSDHFKDAFDPKHRWYSGCIPIFADVRKISITSPMVPPPRPPCVSHHLRQYSKVRNIRSKDKDNCNFFLFDFHHQINCLFNFVNSKEDANQVIWKRRCNHASERVCNVVKTNHVLSQYEHVSKSWFEKLALTSYSEKNRVRD